MEEVAKYEAKKLVPVELNLEDVKKYFAPKASDQELFLFMGIAKSYGLNPFKREIHFVKRKWKDQEGTWRERGETVVGYEMYLKRAQATQRLDGWKCWIEKEGSEEKAIIEITRKDWSTPFKWEVLRKEFDKQQASWKAMPSFMLKKVAIAQGFRLAFPEDLGGMPYIPEEINSGSLEELAKEEKAQSESKPEGKKDPIPPPSPTTQSEKTYRIKTIGAPKTSAKTGQIYCDVLTTDDEKFWIGEKDDQLLATAKYVAKENIEVIMLIAKNKRIEKIEPKMGIGNEEDIPNFESEPGQDG